MSATAEQPVQPRLHTIGAVCERLRAERERRRRGLHVEPTDLGPILGGSTG